MFGRKSIDDKNAEIAVQNKLAAGLETTVAEAVAVTEGKAVDGMPAQASDVSPATNSIVSADSLRLDVEAVKIHIEMLIKAFERHFPSINLEKIYNEIKTNG